MAVTELRFRVMACEAHAILVDPAGGAAEHARRRLEELEDRWSRFLPHSDVSRLNTLPDAVIVVSPDTIVLLAAMKRASRLTDGRYDPALLAEINDAGYSASRDGSGRRSQMAALPARAAIAAGGGIGRVAVDAARSAAIAPAGVGLDPGGIGKGLAADMVVAELLAEGTGGALVGVGGDLAAAGTPPTEDGWCVAIEHPLDSTRGLMTLAIPAGGVATSSTVTRTWLQSGDRRHHVIDPATRTCATTDLAAVTVCASSGWEAEAHATAALLAGGDCVLDYLESHGLDGVAMDLDGVVTASPALSGVVTQGRIT